MDGVDPGEWLTARGAHVGELLPVLVNTLESIPAKGGSTLQRQAVEQLGWFSRKRPRGLRRPSGVSWSLGGWNAPAEGTMDASVDPWPNSR
jgi:hypothetical protein